MQYVNCEHCEVVAWLNKVLCCNRSYDIEVKTGLQLSHSNAGTWFVDIEPEDVS